mmetsp:Transcript_42128/g.70307  ORF Transcript_42128/g.70307 Transcript_42128/m.70307 type:complete len:203 (+) Transcript_42128:2289-2897(+)
MPIWRAFEMAEIRLELSRQNLQGRRLSDTVRPHETEHLPGPWHGEPVKLERVGSVAMRRLFFKILGQVDDHNGFERTFLHADTTTDAQLFREEGNFVRRRHLDTELAYLHNRAALSAFVAALFRPTAILGYNCDTGETVLHLIIGLLLGTHCDTARRAQEARGVQEPFKKREGFSREAIESEMRRNARSMQCSRCTTNLRAN